MNRLKGMVLRYILPLSFTPIFWAVLLLAIALPGWLTEALAIGMFVAAIVGGVIVLWHPVGRLRRKRVVVVIVCLGFVAWLWWTDWFLFQEGWNQPSANAFLWILAWPITLLDFLRKNTPEFFVQTAAFGILTIAFILSPAVAFSILGPAAFRRVNADVTGTYPLSGRERLLATTFLLMTVIGVAYFHRLADIGYSWLGELSSASRILFLITMPVLAYLLQPTVKRLRKNWAAIWSSSVLLLILLASLVSLPFSPSKNYSLLRMVLWVPRASYSGSDQIPGAIAGTCLFVSLMIVGGIALGVLFSAFRYLGPWHLTDVIAPHVAGAVFVASALVFATSAGADEQPIGGISAYNGETWQTFTAQTMKGIPLDTAQDILEDSHGYLWVCGDKGVGRYGGVDWQKIEIGGTSEVNGSTLAGTYHMLEDMQGQIWFAGLGSLAMYDGNRWRLWTEPFRGPTQGTGGVEAVYEATALTEDRTGRVWLVVPNTGIWYVHNAKVQWFAGAACTTSVFADREGNLWFSGASDLPRCPALVRYDGNVMQDFASENSLPPGGVSAIAEDRRGRVWIAVQTPTQSPSGINLQQSRVAVYENGLWKTMTEEGSPKATIHAIFGDSQANLWFVTFVGLYRYDGQEWSHLTHPDRFYDYGYGDQWPITEDFRGNLWIGTGWGLIRYNLSNHKLDTFTSLNSGLVVDRVRKVLVDHTGVVWVATSEYRTVGRAPWLAVSLALLFCLGTPTLLYRRYDKLPSTKALRLAAEVERQPEQLYTLHYRLLASTPDPGVVLGCQDAFDRFEWASLPAALAGLTQRADDPVTALENLLAALESTPPQQDWDRLQVLYRFLLDAARADSPDAIAHLEVAIDPMPEGVMVTTRDGVILHLPDFLASELTEALAKIKTIIGNVQKYLDIDSMSDKLSYLAAGLSLVEDLHSQAGGMPAPDGPILSAIASSWRSVIAGDLKRTSGQTQLEVALRTRQALLAEYVTVVFAISNRGRAAATNVTLTILPSPNYELIGEGHFRQDRLSSEQSVYPEFTIKPLTTNDTRIEAAVAWDDQAQSGKSESFSDVLTFFASKGEFKPIKNPYITGTPVSAPQMFRGREDVLKFVLENISGTFQDRPILLHGQRRTGKTSVLYQLRDHHLPAEYIPVYVDMQELAPAIKTDGDFLAEIAYRIGRAARVRGMDVNEPETAAFQDRPTQLFSRFLDELEGKLAGKRVVLMIDEFAEVIEAKVARGELQPDLFGYIRSLMQHRRGLVFIFVGAHRLQELSQGYWSVFFNITLQRRISYLSESETRQLIIEPVAGELTYDDSAVDKMIRVTRGHPYHVQLLCWVLVSHCNERQRNYATIHDVNQALEDILEAGEAHFAFVWQEASPRERVLLALLARTLGSGKEFAALSEIEEALSTTQINWTRSALTQGLDELCKREVLERQGRDDLRYGFQLELVRMWIERYKSLEEAVAGVEPT